MQAIEPRITKDVFAVLSVDNSVKSRASYGGTAPEERARGRPTGGSRRWPEKSRVMRRRNAAIRHALAAVICYGAADQEGWR